MNKKAPNHLWHPIHTKICPLYLWACCLLLNKYLKEQEYHHPQSWLFFKRETTWEQKQETGHILSTLLLFFIFFSVHLSKSAQVSSVTQSCPTLCDPMDCSTPDFLVHHQLLELAQTHVHWVGNAIQPSHPLSTPSPPTQGLFQWVSSSHQVAKVLEFQLQHQSFQWIFSTDFL